MSKLEQFRQWKDSSEEIMRSLIQYLPEKTLQNVAHIYAIYNQPERDEVTRRGEAINFLRRTLESFAMPNVQCSLKGIVIQTEKSTVTVTWSQLLDCILEDSGTQGYLQQERINQMAKTQPPTHLLTYFYAASCPHCALVLGLLQKYLTSHPAVMLIKVDAATETGTAYLESTLKGSCEEGKCEVPTIIVDNKILIKGDVDFLQRLSYALHLSKETPEAREDEQRCLLTA